MKLELKHIAPYLPYGLIGEYEVSEVVPNAKQELRTKTLTTTSVDMFLAYCKPILRPLSDLTKEIEHNAEKFIPIQELESYDITIGVVAITTSNIYLQRLWVIQKLLEWHFDVFGLIHAGLAIESPELLEAVSND